MPKSGAEIVTHSHGFPQRVGLLHAMYGIDTICQRSQTLEEMLANFSVRIVQSIIM